LPYQTLKQNDMINTKTIGKKIAEARKKINLSQSELAKHVSISPQAVGKWERGESMPDITTLNQLAEIFCVDLNYFSEGFQTIREEGNGNQSVKTQTSSPPSEVKEKQSWDMSKGNWVDADFSGLKNLHEKFSSSNMQRCKFMGSDLSGIQLKGNNIDNCDFSESKITKSNIQGSYLMNNKFVNCSLIETEFSNSFISGCDFSNADLTGVSINSGGLEKSTIDNAIWNNTSFVDSYLGELVFSGSMEDCSFENCGFAKVKFQNARILNTFFKNNRKLKKVQFIDCEADRMTYEFLKNGKANLDGVTLIKA
jgi:uncharacterized protein YjbI with pentapeptide repeats